jgi:pimeloyl-ACP methyl ester carboxylesterase
MIERFLAERGIYYRTNELVPDRPTLVFAHGVSGSSSAWRAYEARFETQCNVVTYDLRGHGKSVKYARYRDYAIRCFVDDLEALLAHLGIGSCVLVAHSFAVLIALAFLRSHQALVRGAVLVSADYDAGRRLPAKALNVALAPMALLDWVPFDPPPGVHIDYARYADSGDWNVRRMLADIGNTTWRVYLSCSRQAMTVHAEPWLPAIDVPVLLVHGERDTVFPIDSAKYMASRLPSAELVTLDADHIVVLNRPREVGDAIERFLSRWPRPTASRALRLVTRTAAAVHDPEDHDAGHGVADRADR